MEAGFCTSRNGADLHVLNPSYHMKAGILPLAGPMAPLWCAVLLASVASAQQSDRGFTERPLARDIQANAHRSTAPTLGGFQLRDAFYSEDFSGGGLPAGWTNVDELTPFGLTPVLFEWSNDPAAVEIAAVSYPDIVGTFNAPGASNGYLWANSDRGLTSAPVSDHLTRLTTSAIDCSGQTSVMLSMQSTIGVFDNNANEFVKVKVSTDLSSWTEFFPFPCLETGNPTPPCSRFSANPQAIFLDITSAAANQSSVYIQFEWEGGWEYWWGIDDLQLSPLPDNELIMNSAYNSTTDSGEEYGRIPSAQLPAAMNVGAELTNFGISEQTNVVLNVAFEDASGSPVPGFSTTIPVGSIPSATTVLVEGSVDLPVGLANGVYTSRFTMESDQLALDNNPEDNERSRNFEVTSDVYALDAIGNHPEGTEVLAQYGTATFEDNFEMNYMSMYLINNPMDVTGIIVSLGSATVAGPEARIEVFLLDTTDVLATPSNISLPVDGVTSGVHVIDDNDVASGSVQLPLEQTVTLAPGGYYAVARVWGSGTVSADNDEDPEVYILDDATVPQPTIASGVYLPVDFNDDGTEGRHFYINGEAFAIRLTTLPTVGLREVAPLPGITLFPNPTNGVFRIDSDRTDMLYVEITDQHGKLARTERFSGTTTIDISDLAAGVYNVAISSATERTVQRVTIQ